MVEALATGFKTTSYLHTQLMEMNEVAARKKTSVFVVCVCVNETQSASRLVSDANVYTRSSHRHRTQIIIIELTSTWRASEANERNARLR